MSAFYTELCKVLEESQILQNEPMKKHTTFRAGGPAAWYLLPDTVKQLKEVISLCREQRVPFYILGNGSNLLVSDRGYDGAIIAMGKGFGGLKTEGGIITAGAGVLLSAVAKRALEENLAGMEFAAGIPGSVGGAVVMNAGAYGSEMKDVLRRVKVLSEAGEILKLSVQELELGYRRSCIRKSGYVVLEAQFALQPGSREDIRGKMDELAARRREKQPLEYPSAGSTFKRPEGYFAGKLIQDAGLRGYRIGGAQVSEKHCGFVINRENASADDIWRLCSKIQDKIYETFGVKLETEVETLGEFKR